MTRINVLRNAARTRDCVAWGKNTGALMFGALLIVCSLAVGCNSDKPKPVSSNNPIPVTQGSTTNTQLSSNLPAPITASTSEPVKPAAKKVVKKRPATVTYVDQTYGVSFEYPRKYGLETGNAANELVATSPLPMNFVVPGGVALAAVELPETAFADTDLSGAFFNVSVNKTLTAEQCGEFAVPQPKMASSLAATSTAPQTASTETEAQSATQSSADQPSSSSTTPVAAPSAAPTSSSVTSTSMPSSQTSKLMLGDLELQSAEAVAGEGDRQSDTKYFHLFQNGGCYEFALNVTTIAHETEGGMKHVDRDKVFSRLSAILATVKINPVTSDVTASAPAAPASEAPAQ